jgi:uncharacterized ferritin-like protein (DUF455 family)
MTGQGKELPDLDPGPFVLCPESTRPPKARRLETPQGLGDRLRTAAFAEWQAVAGFRWAADHFNDVPEPLRADWKGQVADEVRHYNLIRGRMAELGVGLDDRPVSDALWQSLRECETGRQFCLRVTSAEERGRQAALKISTFLADSDPVTAAIFKEIAADEVVHVSLARTYFDWSPA